MKRVICMILAAVMAFGMVCTAAGAETASQKPTYNYVALGDSIGAGYGISGKSLGEDPALVVTEELLANPVQEAYPAVFGEHVAEWGAERGYDVNTANLCACGYRAEDVARLIQEDGYKSPIAEYLVQSVISSSEENPLDKYHEIFTKYLKDADLVSIQLGGNDLLMGVIVPMTDGSNPILTSVGLAMTMVFVGMDTESALGVALMVLEYYKDSITYQTVIDAVKYLSTLYQRAEACVELGSEGVKQVIEEIKALNGSTDIAVLGMFNPYGNSLEYNGQAQTASTVVTSIISESVAYLIGPDASPDQKARAEALLAIAQSKLAYPIQYLFAAKTVDKLILSLNEKLEKVAEEEGVPYVDVYGISNECNLDPHPDVQRHKEIAGLMADALHDTVIEKMPLLPDAIVGDVDGDGEVTVLDATQIQRYVAELITLSDAELKRADVDGDGEVSIIDATLIQRYIADLESPEGIGKPIS